LNDTQAIESLVVTFNQLFQVDSTQVDRVWIQRLQSIMIIMQRGVTVLSLLLGLAVLLITGNSIRLELQNRRDEVLVAKLIGATHVFIQRPFLYTGFWLGFMSGAVAWLLVAFMVLLLQQPIERLSVLYNSSFTVHHLGITESSIMLAITSLLGIIGAWGVLHYQLRQIKPE
jgi:cell division transport system permease protein